MPESCSSGPGPPWRDPDQGRAPLRRFALCGVGLAGSGAGAPCAAALEPSASGFLVGGEERESEGLGAGEREPTERLDVQPRSGLGPDAPGVRGDRVPDLPAVTGAGVAPVERAPLPVELLLVSALRDVAPRGARDGGDGGDGA